MTATLPVCGWTLLTVPTLTPRMRTGVPGYTPTYIHNGNFLDSQWTTTLDLTHPFKVGLADPVDVAAGLEYRKENYTLQAGDPASYYTGTGKLAAGTQGFFG